MNKIIYLYGYGRCGSTILSLLLDRHPDIFSTGELISLPERGWIKNTRCSCKKRADECPFWTQVREIWQENSPVKNPEEFNELLNPYKNYFSFSRRNSHHRLVQENENIDLLMRSITTLYDAIFKVSGKSVIFDSSKLPMFGLVVGSNHKYRVDPVFMIRDGRGVINSLEKTRVKKRRESRSFYARQKNLFLSSIKWAVANFICEYVLRKQDSDFIKLRYEDLVSSPEATLNEILNQVQLDNHTFESPDQHTSHVLAGNIKRLKDDVSIKPDIDWQTSLKLYEELCYWMITGGLGLKYGYRPGKFN